MSNALADRQFALTPAVGTGLWAVAVLAFGVGDLATTLVGLSLAGVTEVGPVAGPLFDSHGPAGMVGLKLASLAVFYAVWRLVPRPYAVGVPAGLVVVGVGVTGWNLVVIGAAASA